MVGTNHSRRELLRTGGAALGAAALGTVAGCSGIPLLGGGESPGQSVYTEWLPEPGEIEDDRDTYRFEYTEVSQLRNHEDALGDWYDSKEDRLEIDEGPISVDIEAIEEYVSFGAQEVYGGSFEKEALVDELDDSDSYEDIGSHEEFDVFSNDGYNGVAVSPDRLCTLSIRSQDDIEEVLEIILETKNGEGDRFTDDEEDFEKLTSTLGGGTIVSGGPWRSSSTYEDAVYQGTSQDVGSDRIDEKTVYVFEDSDDLDEDVKETFKGEAEKAEIYERIDGASASFDGRIAVLEERIITSELAE